MNIVAMFGAVMPQPSQNVAKKKVAIRKRAKPNEKKEFVFALPFKENPPIIALRARYESENYAFYNNQDSPTEDYLYKALVNFRKQHLDMIDEPTQYKSSFDTQGFNFRPLRKYIDHRDRHGKIISPAECEGKKVFIHARIRAYDFKAKSGVRRCGISIKVRDISLC